ncbi:type VI secretion system baseplate subunit TssF [Deltaproteobacteria bacterium Smac51]|nr:type VI secretion system baseplate subunit TssF [Deltaproteobacteria bacterium Smac51]
MTFNKYYQDELTILRELGREFAAVNPGLAPFLGSTGRDPDVERIMEGFAFLTGRLHQKLDDEFPEITHGLFNLLWPNYLRPVPSCAIVQYTPEAGLSQTQLIPRGTRVESKEVDETSCVFTTIYDVEVSPIKLSQAILREKEGRNILALRLDISGALLQDLTFKNLKFFLTGETALATNLYFTLLKKVESVKLAAYENDGFDRPFFTFGPEAIGPVGFDEQCAMLPYPSNTFPGYRLLQEYCCFPEKFMFLELTLPQSPGECVPEKFAERESFELQFYLKELPPQAELVRAENFRLFCTPVVNLFRYDSAPLLITRKQTEYRIVPDPRHPVNYAVYSVDRVLSWAHNSKSEVEYAAFESFEHGRRAGQVPGYYRLKVRPSLTDEGTETYITIIHPENETAPATETISLELTCTNRMLPMNLSVGDICRQTDDSPQNVSFKNITPLSGSYAPPLGGDLPWRLISNMSLNYISLVDVKALRTVVSTYDFRALHDKRRARILARNLEGLVKVDSRPTDRIYKGLPLRGARTYLTVNQEAFVGEGDMFLFCSLINEFLALYATVNSFHELIVTEEKRGEQYKWPARLGLEML